MRRSKLKRTDFSNFKFRASQIGKLMVGNRNEPTEKQRLRWAELVVADKQTAERKELSEKMRKWRSLSAEERLPATTITHLVDCYVSTVYKRQTDVWGVALEKGVAVEEDSITLLSNIHQRFFKKNEQHFENDFIKGTPDIIIGTPPHAEEVKDVKSSWDIFTFFRIQDKPINSDYYWQLQAYMVLTGAKHATLDYCLVNTPEHIVEQEVRKLFYRSGFNSYEDPEYIKACEELHKNARYDKDIPEVLRHHSYTVERNELDIERMYERIADCRVWLTKYHEVQMQKLQPETALALAS